VSSGSSWVSGTASINTVSSGSSWVSGTLVAGTVTAANIGASSTVFANVFTGANIQLSSTISAATHVGTTFSAGTMYAGTVTAANIGASGSVYASNLSATNAIISNISAGNISSSNIYVSGSVISVNVTSLNLIENNITAGSILSTNITASNISTSSLNAALASQPLFIRNTDDYNYILQYTGGTIDGPILKGNMGGVLAYNQGGQTPALTWLYNPAGPRIGINTTSPGYSLDVNGSVGAISFTGGNIQISDTLKAGTVTTSNIYASSTVYASVFTGGNAQITNTISAATHVGTTFSSGSMHAATMTAANIGASSTVFAATFTGANAQLSGTVSAATLVSNTVTTGSIRVTSIYGIDFANNFGNKQIGLANLAGSSFFGIGANNAAMQYQAGLNSVHRFYIGATEGTSNAALGTSIVEINSSGIICINTVSSAVFTGGSIQLSSTISAGTLVGPTMSAANIYAGTVTAGNVGASSTIFSHTFTGNNAQISGTVSAGTFVGTTMSAGNVHASGNVKSAAGTLGPFIVLQTNFVDATSGNYAAYDAVNTVLFSESGNPGTMSAIGYSNGFGQLSDGSNDNITWNYARFVIRGCSLNSGNTSATIELIPTLINSSTGAVTTQGNFTVTDSGSNRGYTTWISPWFSTTTLSSIQSLGLKVNSMSVGGTPTTGNVRIGPTYLQFKS
jgi:hypothetical protein